LGRCIAAALQMHVASHAHDKRTKQWPSPEPAPARSRPRPHGPRHRSFPARSARHRSGATRRTPPRSTARPAWRESTAIRSGPQRALRCGQPRRALQPDHEQATRQGRRLSPCPTLPPPKRWAVLPTPGVTQATTRRTSPRGRIRASACSGTRHARTATDLTTVARSPTVAWQTASALVRGRCKNRGTIEAEKNMGQAVTCGRDPPQVPTISAVTAEIVATFTPPPRQPSSVTVPPPTGHATCAAQEKSTAAWGESATS
jgi:hypothetical protein